MQAEAELSAMQALQGKAQLALESTINGEHTSVAQLRAQLATAMRNLSDTTVRAPQMTQGRQLFLVQLPRGHLASA